VEAIMNFFKYFVVIILLNISVAVLADDIICPEGETLVPYHNTCMAVPAIPTCPEGETWIPYHRTCAVIETVVDENSI
jgi:hypothetical protein